MSEPRPAVDMNIRVSLDMEQMVKTLAPEQVEAVLVGVATVWRTMSEAERQYSRCAETPPPPAGLE